jgi:hypothetical protein
MLPFMHCQPAIGCAQIEIALNFTVVRELASGNDLFAKGGSRRKSSSLCNKPG